MGKAVTRNLTYAWVEFGDPRDGVVFTDGLYSMGWKSAMRGFPTKRDRLGVRYVDASHPLLPIRFRGSGLLILPNDSVDKHSHAGETNPFIDDPVFADFRKSHTDKEFTTAIKKQNRFIANWVFCPGIKRVSPSESHLTIDPGSTDYCDMVAISGHGAAGMVWGGGEGSMLSNALSFRPVPESDRLKYIIIASCFNLNFSNLDSWLPALRRDKPVHGMFGYREGYPGDQIGEAIFRRFMANLKEGDGKKNTILKAWRDAHTGPQSKIWSALMHTSSAKGDTMAKWLAGKLDAPDKDGEVRSYNSDTYPDGSVFVPEDPLYTVNYYMGSTKITADNSNDSEVGLFPGESGAICIESTNGIPFKQGEAFNLVFYYYRVDKDGMDLNKLLAFGTPPDGRIFQVPDSNRQDTTTFLDGINFTITKPGLTQTKIPFTIRSDAAKLYPVDGNANGFFNIYVTPPERKASESKLLPHHFYREGAWLRPKRA